MSSNKISDREALNVLEALADSVEDMSDVEILEEFRREGRDPEVDAKELQQGLIAFVTSHQRQVLREQHTQAHQKITRSERSLPESSAARRILLRRALEKAPPGLTVQGRNLEEIPDDELVSWLIELAALGCLPDEE